MPSRAPASRLRRGQVARRVGGRVPVRGRGETNPPVPRRKRERNLLYRRRLYTIGNEIASMNLRDFPREIGSDPRKEKKKEKRGQDLKRGMVFPIPAIDDLSHQETATGKRKRRRPFVALVSGIGADLELQFRCQARVHGNPHLIYCILSLKCGEDPFSTMLSRSKQCGLCFRDPDNSVQCLNPLKLFPINPRRR